MSRNTLLLHTDRGSYVGGDIIYGHVYLSIIQPIAAKGLCLEFKGREIVHWQHERTEFYQENGETKTRTVIDEHSGHNIFFKDYFRILDTPGQFPSGLFAYPFQYRLPDNLPGIFKMVKNKHLKHKVKIQYTIRAVLDIPHTKHDLVTKQHLVIHSKLDRAIQPKHEFKEEQVRTLCCIPRGPVSIESWIDKNCYVSGEVAQIHVKVKNGSSVVVNHFNSKLIREINIKDNKGHHKHFIKVISEARYDGCPPMDYRERDIPLLLQSRKAHLLKPATKSSLIDCKYYVQIEMDVPWAPDIIIDSPVMIYSPQNVDWVNFVAPTWTTQCVIGSVCPQLQVPANVLAERVHNGVFVSAPGSGIPQQPTHNNNNNAPYSGVGGPDYKDTSPLLH